MSDASVPSMSKAMLNAARMLGLFAVIGTVLVALSFMLTKEHIDDNKREVLLRELNAVVSKDLMDNDLFNDVIHVYSPSLLGSDEPMAVYRARFQGLPIAVIISAVAPDGYSGSIRLLVGVLVDGTVSGVRVVEHRETPGLGDGIELRKSDWILDFNRRSLTDPGDDGWAVKRDGGVFDQFTGATITPRAVVRAVNRSLQYFAVNQEMLFEKPSDPWQPKQ